MASEVEPSRQSGSNAYITSQVIRYGADDSNWIQAAGFTLLADESPLIDPALLPLQAFDATHSESSLDVTIDTGEGFVGGAYIAKDTETTVQLAQGVNGQKVFVGWDHDATNTVKIGRAHEFDQKDPALHIWTFNTNDAGVTSASDHRPIGYSESGGGGGGGGSLEPDTDVRVVGPDDDHYTTIQEAIDSRPEDRGEIFIHPDYDASAEDWPVEMGTELIRGAGPRRSSIDIGDLSQTAFISNPDNPGGVFGCAFKDIRIQDCHLAIRIEGQHNARLDNVVINGCNRGVHTQHGGGDLRPDSFSHLFTNVRVRGLGAGGGPAFDIDQDGHNIVMFRCDAIDHNSGIDIFGSVGVNLIGCSMQLNDRYGAYIQGCRALNISGCYIEGNGAELSGSSGAGILLDNVDGGVVQACYFNGFDIMGHGVNTNHFRGPRRVTIRNCVYGDLVHGFININKGADIPAEDVDVMRHTHVAYDDTPFWNEGSRSTGDLGTRTRSGNVILSGRFDETVGRYTGDLMIGDGTEGGVGEGDLGVWSGANGVWRVTNYATTIDPV